MVANSRFDNNNNSNDSNAGNVYGAVIYRRFTSTVHLLNVEQCQVAEHPQIKPNNHIHHCCLLELSN